MREYPLYIYTISHACNKDGVIEAKRQNRAN